MLDRNGSGLPGARWRKLAGQFTNGDCGIAEGLNKVYAGRPS
jgi:hypothetical protein